jgi:DnaJ-domain-containing protein 1
MVNGRIVRQVISGPERKEAKCRLKKARQTLRAIEEELQLFEQHKENLATIAQKIAMPDNEYSSRHKLNVLNVRKKDLERWKEELAQFITDNSPESFYDYLNIARMKGYTG